MKWYLVIICVITLLCAFYLAYVDEMVSVIPMCISLMLIEYTVYVFREDKRKLKGGW